MRRQRMVLLAVLVATAGLFVSTLSAARGDLDPTFGSGGKVTTDFGGSEVAQAVALQPDGRIVVAGDHDDLSTTDDFVLARYTADGALDSTFGGGGKVSTDFGGNFDGARALALQADGKIVAAGYGFRPGPGPQHFALARYNRDGTLDGTFGDGGRMLTSLSVYSSAFAVLIQPDGKIVAAGRTRAAARDDFALARYLPDGTLDPSFGGDGLVTTAVTPADDYVLDLALQTDGKILAAGSTFDTVNRALSDIALARYNPDGTLDASFDGDGLVVAPFAPDRFGASDIALQRDGKILTAGDRVARFNPDGSVDRSFGHGGQAFEGVYAAALAVQPDGKILAVGYHFEPPSTPSDIAVARLTTAGRLDWTYGRNGLVTTDVGSGSEDYADSAALGADGKLVVAGATRPTPYSAPWDFVVARYVAIPFCVVPNVRGQTLRAARARLARASCGTGKITRAYSQRVKRDHVMSQRPKMGAHLPELAKVALVVSRGRRPTSR